MTRDTENPHNDNPYLKLLFFEKELRQATDESQLQMVLVNRLRSLIDAQQLLLFRYTASGKLKLCRCSDTDSVDAHSARVRALEQMVSGFQQKTSASEVQRISTDAMNPTQEAGVLGLQGASLWVPLKHPHPDEQQLGVLLLNRDRVFTEQEQTLAEHIGATFAHAWQAKLPGYSQWLKMFGRRRFHWGLFLLISMTMFIPVRLSVLAPAEVIALRPELITAPITGVVKEIRVTPHQQVTQGQPLVLFEDTRFRNQKELASKELAVAQAQLRKVQQQSFRDAKSSGQLAELKAAVRLKTSEFLYASELLQRTKVVAGEPGIAVFRNEEDWEGRPVQQGERILYIANPGSVELRIMLSIRDAISLKRDSHVRLFLDSDPLNPIDARLSYFSYDAEPTPEGVMAYRLTATFISPDSAPRIGLQGTAKLYGETSTLFVYLFRRPLVFIRQWLGV